MEHDKVALALLGFVTLLETANVGVAMATGRSTLPAIDLLFTTTGGAVLTESLARRSRRHHPPTTKGDPDGGS